MSIQVTYQCQTQSIFGDTTYWCYCKFNLVTPMVGAEETKFFGFDNPRSLEKVLSGTELHRKLLLLTESTKTTKTTSQKS